MIFYTQFVVPIRQDMLGREAFWSWFVRFIVRNPVHGTRPEAEIDMFLPGSAALTPMLRVFPKSYYHIVFSIA